MKKSVELIPSVLVDKRIVATDTMSLTFKPHKKLVFIPGQNITIDLKKSSKAHGGKIYTISSSPDLPTFEITVRKTGLFSAQLHDLAIQSNVYISGPHGTHYPTKHMKHIVCIAGGVGITPFMSMIRYFLAHPEARPKSFLLIYSNKAKSDIAFFDELTAAEKQWKGLQIIHTLTRAKKSARIAESGRINARMIKKYAKKPDNHYFICGSTDFVDDMWRILVKIDVPQDHILTEAFY